MKRLLTALALVCFVVGAVNFFLARGSTNPVLSNSVLITNPLLVIGVIYLLFAQIFPRAIYRAPQEQLVATERAIAQSGQPLSSISCVGKIGAVGFSGLTLRATIFPGGLVIKPPFLDSFAVAAHEITGAEFKRQRGDLALEIDHTSSQVATPIRLRCVGKPQFVAALESIRA